MSKSRSNIAEAMCAENQRQSSGNANTTFDPLTTLGPWMSLYMLDHRKVFYKQRSGLIDQCTLMIKDTKSGSPLYRWKIYVPVKNYDWTIGFCENADLIDVENVYALCIKDDQLSSLSMLTSSQPIPGAEGMVRPKIVEVCLNPQDSSVSFFICGSPHYTRRLVVSIDVSISRSATLKPFVKLQTQTLGQSMGLEQLDPVRERLRQIVADIPRCNYGFNVPSSGKSRLLCELL